jgi:hypothetical protein
MSKPIRSGPTSGLFRIDRSAHPNVLPWQDTCGTLLDLNSNVRFSNRPFGVKRFQTIHQHSVNVSASAASFFWRLT